jgi:transposase
MNESTTYVGMDVHKEMITVAILRPGSELPAVWEVQNRPEKIRKTLRKVRAESPQGTVLYCYEAGPCGYGIQRQIREQGEECLVVAPSLIPKKPGERVKTDRRDSKKLAMLLRAGMLTAVFPPTPEEESVRDLCRAREDAQEDLMRHRHQLGKFLLRRDQRFEATARSWTNKHWVWLRGLKFALPADQSTFDDYLLAIEQCQARIEKLESKIVAISECAPYAMPVGWLCCFRGISTLAAMVMLSELHELGMRFTSAREVMAFVGMVSSEYSSGQSELRGSITKTGNGHVRKMAIQCALAYMHRPSVGRILGARRAGQPDWVIAMADRAQQRLHKRYWHLTHKGKVHNKAIVAIARELMGFLWAVMRESKDRGHLTIREQFANRAA